MKTLKTALVFLPLCGIPTALGGLPGPSYPSPKNITGHTSHVAAAWKNVTITLNQALNGSGVGKVVSSLLRNTTFSMGMFSLHDQNAQSMQYHHTALSTLNGTVGTKNVDADSIYRIASVSKLITAYVGMIELDDKDWNTPLSTIFSGFKDVVEKAAPNFDAVKDIQWDKITVSDIAAHIGGIPRLSIPISGDFLSKSLGNASLLDTWGLPPANLSKIIAQYPCSKHVFSGEYDKCNSQEYAQGMAANVPRYLPAASPLYSDSGFFLLGGALTNLTGKSMDDLYRESVFKPLRLQNTLSIPPSDPAVIDRTVIPGVLEEDLLNIPVTTPSGGLYSTINDLAKIGISILNSTLLPAEKTNRWMKPVSFTGHLNYAAGRPWEIYRYVHPKTGIVTNIYTKLGDSGNYCALLALVPDFGLGFTILGASSIAVHTQALQLVADLLTESIMPALMKQARHEALANLAGTYVPKDKSLNTTLTLAVPTSSNAEPGLVITDWISNGTDMKSILAPSLISMIPHIPARPANPHFLRLVPAIQDVAASGQISFQMETVNPTGPVKGHLFSRMYDEGDWSSTIDQLTYRDVPVNEFVFHVDKKTGRANTVTPSAYNVKLGRKSGSNKS